MTRHSAQGAPVRWRRGGPADDSDSEVGRIVVATREGERHLHHPTVVMDQENTPAQRPSVSRSRLGAASAGPASRALAFEVERRLAQRVVLTARDLFGLAAEGFGGTLAEGAFSPRDAYDAAELGLHLCLLRGAGALPGGALPADPDAFTEALGEVERLAALLPTQTRRTAEQNDFQQFSTPAPYAALCTWVAGVRPGDRVLEPSAGTGALCAFALAAGGAVHANELSKRRADLLSVLLREAGQDPAETLTRENADHLDAILPARVRADVVLLNPPFSQTAGRLGRRCVATVGTDHVLQALRRLDAGGRLVAILSASVQRSKLAYRSFCEAVDADSFQLRADVEVGGSVYRPNGTSVRTRLLVVDRVLENSPGRGRECVGGVVDAMADAVDLLASTRACRLARG